MKRRGFTNTSKYGFGVKNGYGLGTDGGSGSEHCITQGTDGTNYGIKRSLPTPFGSVDPERTPEGVLIYDFYCQTSGEVFLRLGDDGQYEVQGIMQLDITYNVNQVLTMTWLEVDNMYVADDNAFTAYATAIPVDEEYCVTIKGVPEITTFIQLTYNELFRDAPAYFPNVIEDMGGLYNGQAYGANHIVPDGSGVDYAIGAGSTPPVYNEDVDNFTILINTSNTGTITADGADFECTVAGSADRPQLQTNMIDGITDVLYNVRYIVTIHTGTAYVSHTQDGDVAGGSNITDINETLPVGTYTYEEQGYARTGDWFRIYFDSSVEFTWTGSVVVEIERV